MKRFVSTFFCLAALAIGAAQARDSQVYSLPEADRRFIIEHFDAVRYEKGYLWYVDKFGKDDPYADTVLVAALLNGLAGKYAAERETFWVAVAIVGRAKVADFGTQMFHNPLKDMIDADDFESFGRAVKVAPALLRAPDNSWAGNFDTPLAHAVRRGKAAWIDFILAAGATLTEAAYVYPKGYESNYRMNLLSIAPTAEIAAKLLSLGVERFAAVEWDSSCTGVDARARAEPSVDAKVLGYIPKGATIRVLGHTYAFYTLADGRTGRWVKVRWKGMECWMWSEYVWEYER